LNPVLYTLYENGMCYHNHTTECTCVALTSASLMMPCAVQLAVSGKAYMSRGCTVRRTDVWCLIFVWYRKHIKWKASFNSSYKNCRAWAAVVS